MPRYLVAPRNRQEGEECGDCSTGGEGSGGIGLMPSINLGPTSGCGSCAPGLECVKGNESEEVGKCQYSKPPLPPGSHSIKSYFFLKNQIQFHLLLL